jgi:hypothetical protein
MSAMYRDRYAASLCQPGRFTVFRPAAGAASSRLHCDNDGGSDAKDLTIRTAGNRQCGSRPTGTEVRHARSTLPLSDS